MIVELQLGKPEFELGLLVGFPREALTLDTRFYLDGEESLVDSMAVGDITAELIPGGVVSPPVIGPPIGITDAKAVGVQIPLQARVVSLAELGDNGSEPSTGQTTSIVLHYVFEVQPGPWRVVLRLDAIDLGALLGAISNAANLRSELRGKLENQPITNPLFGGFGLATFTAQLENVLQDFSVTISHAAIGMDLAESLVALRMEINGPTAFSRDDWLAFYRGLIPSRLSGSAWSVFFSRELLVNMVRFIATQMTNKAQADGDFEVTTGINPIWDPALPGIRVAFSGDALDACIIQILHVVFPVDVSYDLDLVIQFSLTPAGRLRTSLQINFTLNDPEVGESCAATLAVTAPFTLAALVDWEAAGPDEGLININDWALILSTHIGMPVVAGMVAMNLLEAPPLPVNQGGFHEVANSSADREYEATSSIIPDSLQSLLAPTGITGISDGLLLTGIISLAATARSARLDVGNPDASAFAWSWGDVCSHNPSFGAKAAWGLHNAGPKNDPFHTPLTLSSITILDDDLNQFGPYLTNEFHDHLEDGLIGLIIPWESVSPVYLQNPYPCKVLVQTSGGARLLTLPPLTELSQGDYIQDKLEMEAYRVIHCKTWAHFFWGRVFNPLWHINPGPDDKFSLQSWTFTVDEAIPGSEMILSDPAGDVLGRGMVNTHGHAMMSVLTTPVDGQQHLSVSFRAGETAQIRNMSGDGAEVPAGRLHVNQQRLRFTGSIPFSQEIRSLNMADYRGHPSLFCSVGESLSIVNIRHHDRTQLLEVIREPGLKGTTVWNQRVVLWGRLGAKMLDGPQQTTLLAEPVDFVAVRGLWLYLLSQGAIQVLGPDAECAEVLKVGAFCHGRQFGSRLVLWKSDEMLFIDIRKGSLHVVGRSAQKGVERMGAAHPVRNQQPLFSVADCNGRARVLTLDADGQVEEIARHESALAYIDTVRLGRVVAQRSADRKHVLLYHADPSRDLTEKEIIGKKRVRDRKVDMAQ